MGNKKSINAPLSNIVTMANGSSRKNEEPITLVWYEEWNGNDLSHDDKIFRRQTLRQINDYVLFFQDKHDFLHYIHLNQDEQIFIIIVPYCHSDELLSNIHILKQIYSIFLYSTVGRNKYTRLLTEKYSKIIGCFINQQELMDILQKRIKLLMRQSAMFNLYDDKKQMTARDLTKESGSFLFFQLFRHITLITKKNNESKRTMVAKCRVYYHDNKKQLESISLFERTYQSSEAIYWYTRDTFVHRIINKALRTEDIDALFTFQFFITDLSLSLMIHFRRLKKIETSPKLILYRGLNLPEDEIEILRQNVGKLVSTNGYLSTSRSRDVAVMFANKVIMEIEMDMKLETVICADIADSSVFNDEGEVLFDIGAVFEMVNCVEEFEDMNANSNMNKILVFKMKATDKGSEIAKEYIEYQKKRISQSDITLMFGCLLADMGQYKKSSQHFERILYERPNDEKIACIYSSLARTCRLDGQYERSIYYYKQAYDMHTRIQPPRLISAARALNGLGIVYSEQHDYNSALENLTLSLKLYRKYGKEDEEYAGILNNIASIYCSLNELDKALDNFEKVKEIHDRILPSDHSNRAATFINIGNVYYEKKDYTTSLDYYMKCLKIKEKILPVEHQDKIRCLDNIGLVYYRMKNYQEAYVYFQKALMMAEKILTRNHVLFNDLHDHIKLVKNDCLDVETSMAPSATQAIMS
ncbi:unnamed protein product [Rotaria sp. Silwood1]|nr:unnamed protein product [Rotaria sp. Silwood1]CAF4907455.1 unnamed protein product [Rotaria sp. Silwood1]